MKSRGWGLQFARKRRNGHKEERAACGATADSPGHGNPAQAAVEPERRHQTRPPTPTPWQPTATRHEADAAAPSLAVPRHRDLWAQPTRRHSEHPAATAPWNLLGAGVATPSSTSPQIAQHRRAPAANRRQARGGTESCGPHGFAHSVARKARCGLGCDQVAGRGGGLHLGVRLKGFYSHSMVPGGLLVTSRTTRLTSRTSLVMRVEMRAIRS